MASPILPGSGLGSGLDIGAIVTALVNADKSAKQTQIDTATKTNTLKISGVGSLKSALTAFQTAMTNLSSKTSPAFAGFTATSGNTDILSATSDSTAVAGKYNVVVNKLATGSKIASASFAGGAASAIPSGTLKISQNGTDYNVDIPANATLQTTRDAINKAQGANGISANIVTDSSGSSRLVISSSKTGAGSDLTVSGIAGLEIDGTQPMGASPAAGASGAVSGIAQNAELTIDGLTVTSKSNTVSGAISGLTLNLTTVTPTNGAPTVVSVDANTKGLQTSIQTFVDAYNALKTTVDTLSKATPDEDGKLTVQAAFTGDSLPRSLIADIREQLTAVGAGGPLAVLSQLGVMTDRNTGNLTFDTAAFNKTMDQPGMTGQVQQLFTGTDDNNGLLARMKAAVDPYLKAPAGSKVTAGLLDQRLTILNNNTRNLTNQQLALDLRVANLTKTLTAKYNAMDLLVGQMKATASNITSFFSSLNAQQSAK
ncbi:flagellar filament capping protein FliD [Pseudomonas granadensis]|uniref:flagellar filament capping protein FliD n=1 Tax=Pseudomonas granadensis TaxID=1421430 RepID=UPI0019D0AEF7|nr:flagellar filament capping protein FliD [Pseudomonas granadensis]MBN6773454.1 flagellar filament capping protein FliD [Pseudomonas granadensis]MBN6804757.1 flagellar filament capping protein FliD [Pseudomonas granadensis]MBN6831903.1 flagellar filament capping protein FliD [Pseudomonas granadensis]MBN6838528.1 flagellar filament capping protein FliD [Pseudomonas granadensis]MBN6866865.1 flagellar filament capping protein FliD [Pseudomonas granadensis]